MKTINEMNNNSKYITDNEIKEILRKPVLTIVDITTITGMSRHMAKQIRLKVVEKESDFFYTTKSHIRTDHFLKYYKSDHLNKIYHDVFGVDLA